MNTVGNPTTPAMATRKRGYRKRLVAAFAVLVLILGAVAVQVHRVVGEFVDSNSRVLHSLEVKQEITLILATLHDIEASQRAYLISGSSRRLEDYYQDAPQIVAHNNRLIDLVADNEGQSQMATQLRDLVEQRMAGMNVLLTRYLEGGLPAVRESAQLASALEEDLRVGALGKALIQAEEKLLIQREQRIGEMALLTRVLTGGAVLICLIILSLTLVALLREESHRRHGEGLVKSANVELIHSLNKSQELARTLHHLSELGEMLQGCRSMEEATRSLQISLPHLLAGTSGAIGLINSAKNLVESMAVWGRHPDARNDGAFAPNDCWALRRGHAYPAAGSLPSFTCQHLHTDANADEQILADHRHLCLPMIAQGEMLGVLTLTSATAISPENREIAIAASEQISLAMANLRLQETLRSQSLRDPLTGLFNRRYLEASFEREIQRAERRQQPLSVLLLDIDHFKRFNDTYGHDAGDTLLAQFGSMLGRIVRSDDVTCRYGGEEFTILMPEADAAQAQQRAEEICAATRSLDVQHRGLSLGKVTVSIGVATWGEHGRNPEELLRNADNALYLAKSQGRDRSVLAEVLHPRNKSRTPPSKASVSLLNSNKAS